MIRARLSDATACFNLNSVVEGTGELWQRRESGSRQFTALLRALDVPQVQADGLVDSLVDWIDSDQAPGPAGAEDASYLVRDPAYRTGRSAERRVGTACVRTCRSRWSTDP